MTSPSEENLNPEGPLPVDLERLGRLREQCSPVAYEQVAENWLLDLVHDEKISSKLHHLVEIGLDPLEAIRAVSHDAVPRMFELFREDLEPDVEVLDFGCGRGSLANYALTYDDLPNPFIGIDLEDPGSSLGKRMRFYQKDLHEFEWDGEPFQRVISLHVFEHVPRPGELCYKLRSLMAKGGRALIAVPDCSTMFDMLQHVWAREECDHINAFTRDTFNEMMAAAGFKCIRQSLWPGYYGLSYKEARLENGRPLGALLDRLAADLDFVHGTTICSSYGFSAEYEAV